jgi:hypothetical protein
MSMQPALRSRTDVPLWYIRARTRRGGGSVDGTLRVAGAVMALGALAVVLSRVRMARAHRQVGQMTWWLMIGGALIVAGTSMFVAPGAWRAVYRFMTGRYSGD